MMGTLRWKIDRKYPLRIHGTIVHLLTFTLKKMNEIQGKYTNSMDL